MKTHLIAVAVAALSLMPQIGSADAALGLWHTEPDRKAQTAHVSVVRCGAALCGTILKAFDKNGREITTPNVGRRIFWDVKPTGKGDYAGQAFVPMLGKEYPAKMNVSGNRMVVKGCAGPICMSQKWNRVRG